MRTSPVLNTTPEQDAQYLIDRARIASNHFLPDLWTISDAWPVFVGMQQLARQMILINALRFTLATQGEILEFGAWRGATTMLWGKLLELWDPGSAKRVHAFDRWAGGFEAVQWAPEDNPEAVSKYVSRFRGDMLPLLEDMIRLYNLDRVRLHQGYIEDTWPAWKKEHPGTPVSLVLLDVDLYRPTACALNGLHERMTPGGIILVDEYGHPDWPGETQAVDEFLAEYPGQYAPRAITEAVQPSLWIMRKRV